MKQPIAKGLVDVESVIAILRNEYNRKGYRYGFLSDECEDIRDIIEMVKKLEIKEAVPAEYIRSAIKSGRRRKCPEIDNALDILEGALNDWGMAQQMRAMSED